YLLLVIFNLSDVELDGLEGVSPSLRPAILWLNQAGPFGVRLEMEDLSLLRKWQSFFTAARQA
ncbi:MAG: hypothetical protein LHV69_08250, partial [Elusimicrobia bacterium]|nr:hypothetical protein [Candidatus Obscuribacterium magneticum]